MSQDKGSLIKQNKRFILSCPAATMSSQFLGRRAAVAIAMTLEGKCCHDEHTHTPLLLAPTAEQISCEKIPLVTLGQLSCLCPLPGFCPQWGILQSLDTAPEHWGALSTFLIPIPSTGRAAQGKINSPQAHPGYSAWPKPHPDIPSRSPGWDNDISTKPLPRFVKAFVWKAESCPGFETSRSQCLRTKTFQIQTGTWGWNLALSEEFWAVPLRTQTVLPHFSFPPNSLPFLHTL